VTLYIALADSWNQSLIVTLEIKMTIVLGVADAVVVNYGVIVTKIIRIVLEITTRIMIIQRILNFWGAFKSIRGLLGSGRGPVRSRR